VVLYRDGDGIIIFFACVQGICFSYVRAELYGLWRLRRFEAFRALPEPVFVYGLRLPRDRFRAN